MKEYCKYLLDIYSSINSMAQESGFYWQLNQFLTEGKVKDILSKNTKTEIKIQWLNIMRDDLLSFAKSQDIKVEVLNFLDYGRASSR